MLVLTRSIGETVIIGNGLGSVTVDQIDELTVRFIARWEAHIWTVTLRKGQALLLCEGTDYIVRVLNFSRYNAILGFDLPKSIAVDREEIHIKKTAKR